MDELLALTRLSLVRSRLLLTLMAAAVVMAVATAFFAGQLSPESIGQDSILQKFVFFTFLFTLIPAVVSSLLLFDYSAEGNMNLPESGCSHWILRMPIKSWKIASVPLVLKTLWITAIWLLFVAIARYLGRNETIPLVAPSICFSAAAVWVLVLAWHPFRVGWHRIFALLIAMVVLYCCVGSVFLSPSLKQVEWRPVATFATNVTVSVLYAVGVWLTIRAVTIARTSMTGVIPEYGEQRHASWLAGGGDRERRFKSPIHALVSHDLTKSKGWIRRTFIIGVMPAILIFSLFIPVSIPSVVLIFFVFAYAAAITISRTGYSSEMGMPPHLATSPLSNSTIAWTKFVATMLLATSVFFFILFAFAGWACWAENREVWLRWSSMRANEVGSNDVLLIGLRWCCATVIAVATFTIGRLASFHWIALTGRQWVGVVMAVVIGLTILIPMGVVIRWFIQQQDWESTTNAALKYASYLPAIVVGLLVVKGLCAVASIAILRWQSLASFNSVSWVIAIWTVITLLVATSLVILIPDPRATYLWCLGLTALAIPLARLLVLPAAVAWNRHR